MKTEVIISNGQATLTLTPEFEFEKTLIEDMQKESLVVLRTSIQKPDDYEWYGREKKKHQIQFHLGQLPPPREPEAGC